LSIQKVVAVQLLAILLIVAVAVVELLLLGLVVLLSFAMQTHSGLQRQQAHQQ
jgi:hypothetical protein